MSILKPHSLAAALAVAFTACQASAQNIYVGQYFSGNILEFTPGGSQSTFSSGDGQVAGIAFASSGNLFQANNFGSINQIPPSGSASSFASIYEPNGVAFSANTLFVSSYGNGTIYEVNSSGTVSTFASGFSNPTGMAFDTSGDLFLATYGGNNVYEFKNNDGTLSSTPTVFASGISSPWGLAFNAVGDLFVSSDVSAGTITEVTPNGTESPFATGLDGPNGIAFDSSGNLYVADSFNGDITKITSGDSESTFMTGLSDPTGLAISNMTLPVPEPSSLALAALGTTAFFFRRRKI
jgi:sugar lactone lactonase YvrE